MKISNLQIGGFGVWSGLDIDELAPDLTVVFGPNEAGKTTLMQFIRSMLYGFSEERRERYLPPVAGGPAGGAMEIQNQHGSYVLRRRAELRGKTWREQLKIHTEDGKTLEAGALSNVLAGVDEATFNNVFAVGLRELQELGTLNDTAAADHLYKLTSGMDRISLVDVVRLLGSLRLRLLCEDDGESEITTLLKQRQQLRSQIIDLSDRANRWYEVRSERTKLQDEVQRLEGQIHAQQQETRTVEIATRVRDAWLGKAQRQSELSIALG